MISAIVTHLDDARRLEASLAALAPAAIDGLVREALLVDVGAGEAIREAADDAGATLVPSNTEPEGLAAAGSAARGTWLLILPCGVRLEARWEPAARRHIERYPSHGAWFALAADADGLSARLAEAGAAVAAGWLGRPGPRQGLLLTRQHFTRALGGAVSIDHASLVRRVGPLRPLGVKALS
jgi:hypothetical protein